MRHPHEDTPTRCLPTTPQLRQEILELSEEGQLALLVLLLAQNLSPNTLTTGKSTITLLLDRALEAEQDPRLPQ